MTTPDITSGIAAIDHHSHASMAGFRTVEQIERHFSTAHLEANVAPEVYDAFILARNRGDTLTLAQLETDHGTERLMQQGVAFRSTTFFSRALRQGCQLLYGPHQDQDSLAQKAREWGGRSPSYTYDQALKAANTPIVLVDVPYLDRETWNPAQYRQIMRIDPYVYPFHNGKATLRGTEFQRFHAGFAAVLRSELKSHALDDPPLTFDAYLQFMDASIQRRVQNGVIGLKIASAYVRPIDFRPASFDDARASYEALAVGKDADRRPMENFLVQRAAQYAADNALPMQIHVGMGHPEPGMLIANGAPFLLETFLNIRSLSRLKVTLLHGGYPFSSDMAALVQTYGNVYLDFSWMPYLHHYYLRQKLTEWLEILPANKLLYGSDSGAPEFHVAAASYAREALNHVLSDGIQRKVWDARQAQWLARRVLFENAAEIYRLD
ncbi:MAG: amidohydrolase family protein [Rhodoferax sp.]|nr:amidohydrolase family protein [Rhodoferax sp.]